MSELAATLWHSLANVFEDALYRRWFLLFRFLLVNISAFFLLALAWSEGWILKVFAADVTPLSAIITVLFGAGMVLCTNRIWNISREMNYVQEENSTPPSHFATYLADTKGGSAENRSLIADTLKLDLSNYISIVPFITRQLVFLGLIGTVIGITIALSNIQPYSVGQQEKTVVMIATLVQGMSVALSTTLVGSVLSVWLGGNYFLLRSGVVNLFVAIVKYGERHEQS